MVQLLLMKSENCMLLSRVHLLFINQLWYKPSVITAANIRLIYHIAPGERSVPLIIFRDKYSEELAYPGIFFDQKRPENEDRLVSLQ